MESEFVAQIERGKRELLNNFLKLAKKSMRKAAGCEFFVKLAKIIFLLAKSKCSQDQLLDDESLSETARVSIGLSMLNPDKCSNQHSRRRSDCHRGSSGVPCGPHAGCSTDPAKKHSADYFAPRMKVVSDENPGNCCGQHCARDYCHPSNPWNYPPREHQRCRRPDEHRQCRVPAMAPEMQLLDAFAPPEQVPFRGKNDACRQTENNDQEPTHLTCCPGRE